MKIAVLGAGGIGGYAGARLADAGFEVHLVARGGHLTASRQHGLSLRSPLGDAVVRAPATDDPAEVGPCDYVLFCVKSYDTDEAAARLGPLLAGHTAVVSFQNGLGNEEAIAGHVGRDRVMGGVAYLYSTIVALGVIAHTAGPARYVFGELDGTRSERAVALHDALREAGVDARISSDIRQTLWSKLTFICAQSGVTAASQLPIGEIRGVPESWDLFRRVAEEVRAVAVADGVALPESAVDEAVAFAEGVDAGTPSSLYYDLTHGRRMELESLHGEVVRRARTHEVPVPACETIYALLRPWAVRNERGRT
jgi:2-dehydropantoate 2-reductase